MPSKKANSQAAWALLTEGVTAARLEAHRLQHLINRASRLVEGSSHKDHLFEVAGDLIVGMPERLDHLITDLDRTGLALSRMGQDFLESRLSIQDKNLVDEAVSSAFGKARPKESEIAQRIARRYLRSKK
jgi:hypothetical protein